MNIPLKVIKDELIEDYINTLDWDSLDESNDLASFYYRTYKRIEENKKNNDDMYSDYDNEKANELIKKLVIAGIEFLSEEEV